MRAYTEKRLPLAAAAAAAVSFVYADEFVTLVASVANVISHVQFLSASSWQPYLGWHI